LLALNPQTLEYWPDGKAGAICTLYGKYLCYWIELDCSIDPAHASLRSGDLDSALEPNLKLAGDATSYALWRSIVREMLTLEGITPEALLKRGYLMT
jgi:hypothetical protein